MNEEYLWDKTGEPDPEIQQLEEILCTLRYQPRPLVLPRELVVIRRRSYLPLLAIAAMIALALLAGGLWLRVQSNKTPESQQTKRDEPVGNPSKPVSAPVVVENKEPKSSETTDKQISKPNQRQNSVATNIRHRRIETIPSLTPREREEALAAKGQLMIALRLASEKLNLVHKKTQSPAQPNQIRNQHKVG